MLKPQDLIVVQVNGTNPETRQTKAFSARFTGEGVRVDDFGNPMPAKPGLTNLPTGTGGGAVAIPEFPHAAFASAQAKGDLKGVKEIQLSYAQALNAVEKQNGGVNPLQQIVSRVLDYAYQNEGFLAQDGNGFVLKQENLSVTPVTVQDKTIYQISGTAVYGG